MFFLFHIILLYTNGNIKADDVKDELNEVNNLTAYNISNRLLSLFDIHYDNERLKQLNKKLERINQYVVDHNLIADVLTNVTMETKLNETNFYQALNENDHYSYLSLNETKNLYLKLKEKMTRDDIIKIAAERGKRNKLVKSARRMMQHTHLTHEDDEKMSDVVDKILAEVPVGKHQVKANKSMVWDPETELAEMKAYQENKKSGRRIYKGERTLIKHYPFMASVQLMGKFWCGAVLLGSDLAITSASCLQLIHNNRFFRENPRVLQLRIGSNHSRIGGELIDVLEVFFHPSYNPKTLKNNLALMRLRHHLFLRKKTFIKYLSMELKGNALPSTSKVLLLGWGVTKLSQKLPYQPIFLQRKILPVYPNAFCREVYGRKFDPDTMFCAGTLTTGEGACDHDSGGPAVLSGRLVGIISFGPAVCGFVDTPTVFTKVGAYSDWIETINETMPTNYIGLARTTTTKKSSIYKMLATYKLHNYAALSKHIVTPVFSAEETERTDAETTAAPSLSTNVTEPTTPEHKYLLRSNDNWLEVLNTEDRDILSTPAGTKFTGFTDEDQNETTQASSIMPSNEEWTAVI